MCCVLYLFFSRFFSTFLQKHEKYTLTVDSHFAITAIQNPSVTTDDVNFLLGQALAPVPCIPGPSHPHPLLGPTPTATIGTLPSTELLQYFD